MFAIQKQLDPNNGCIPACAISVLGTTGAATIPSELALVNAMWVQQRTGSGFERLAVALQGVAVVDIERKVRGQAMIDRLSTLTKGGDLVLVAVYKPAVHCVVVSAVVSGFVRYHDPGDGQAHDESEADFTARTADDLAVLR